MRIIDSNVKNLYMTQKLTFRHLFSLETDIFIFKEQEQREMLRIT